MTPKKVVEIKEVIEVTDKQTIRLLLEPTRAGIIRLLGQEEMTVKQLASALGKNPGTVLHHVDQLKKAGLVFQVRTQRTPTGIVQRYYRSKAREYRLGLEGADRPTLPEQVTDVGLTGTIRGLAAYGVHIPESQVYEAVELLRLLIERERVLRAKLVPQDDRAFKGLSKPVRDRAHRIALQLLFDTDPEYSRLKELWTNLLRKSTGN
ncbi:MAG: winged helix-turn-helix domain-containing protein [Candidatus Hodarchaeota archaeon]